MNDVTREKIYNFLDKNELKILICIGLISFICFLTYLYPKLQEEIPFSRHTRLYSVLFYAQTDDWKDKLTHAAMLYSNRQGKSPEVFSDFVTNNKKVQDKYTISLKNPEIISIENLKSKQLIITFNKGFTASYDLIGTKVNGNIISAK